MVIPLEAVDTIIVRGTCAAGKRAGHGIHAHQHRPPDHGWSPVCGWDTDAGGDDRPDGRSGYDGRVHPLEDYPQLADEDIREALRFAAANIDQRVVPLDQSA
jgi:hypothetical protein